MQAVLYGLADLGPSVAVLLAVGGLTFGLLGWRIIRYVAVVDALLISLWLRAGLERMGDNGEKVLLVRGLTLVLAIVLPWLAWRYHRCAVALLGGAVWFLLPQCLLAGTGTPLIVGVLIGVLACGVAMAMHLTLGREAAVVTTGVHGAFLCLAALAAVSADPRSHGGRLFDALSSHALLLPIVALVFSTIMIVLQWTDLTGEREPRGVT